MPRAPIPAVCISKTLTGSVSRFLLPPASARVQRRSREHRPVDFFDWRSVTMPYEFHSGELEMQTRAGVREVANRVAGSIHSFVPAAAGAFLEERRFVVLAAADAE